MKIFIQSFGCSKNLVDSENLVGLLRSSGHEIIQNIADEEADFAIINTCGFIEEAVKENVSAVIELEDLKKNGQIKAIIVAGCLFNRYSQDLSKEFPNVDLFVKSEDWISILRFLGSQPVENCGRVSLGEKASRYLKIGEGCDSFCSYCTIPMIRGRARSIPIEDLVLEANNLCEQGAKEICVIGQDPTLYGNDLYGAPQLSKLLSELESSVPEGTWLRLLYLHPNRVTREFIEKISQSDKIVPYLDIPIQHIDEEILNGMNRGGDSAHIKDIFRYAREINPLFALRTTVMVGFPGETDEHFKRLLDFIQEFEIDRVGAFQYSQEEGTKAASFPNQVSKKVKTKRYDKVMQLQTKISESRQRLFIGREMKVLIESVDKESKIAWGRSYRDAPEVDGMVGIQLSAKGIKNIKLGSFAEAKILSCTEHDLFGELIKDGKI